MFFAQALHSMAIITPSKNNYVAFHKNLYSHLLGLGTPQTLLGLGSRFGSDKGSSAYSFLGLDDTLVCLCAPCQPDSHHGIQPTPSHSTKNSIKENAIGPASF